MFSCPDFTSVMLNLSTSTPDLGERVLVVRWTLK